ncbi:fas-binding factor 1 isoform X2 [Halyomorpha halys]|uniref:fas-binding factor 1 isoform X2 n=1 Tax=Halyomorpha halys TaxID=286706 RepID=UPI0034D20820
MSASELDKKYHIADPEGKTAGLKSPSKYRSKNKADLQNISSNLEDVVEDDLLRSLPLFKESSGPIGYDTRTDHSKAKKIEKRSKNTADWLGLKDSPEKPHIIDNIYESKISLSSEDENLLKSIDKKVKEDNKKKKEVIDQEPVLPAPAPLVPTMKSRNRNKGILMNELFGDIKFSNEEPAVKVGLDPTGPTLTDGSEKKSFDYTPSMSTTRRNEKKAETSSGSNPGSGLDGEFDWLTGIKSSPAKETPRLNVSDSTRPKTAASPVTSVPQPLKAPPSAGSRKEPKESKIPDWLDELVKDSSQQKKELSAAEDDSKKLPDWLGGTPSKPQLEQSELKQVEHHQANSVQASPQEQVNEVDGNIMSKLASVQMELVAAMSKRTENLQIYMQELMHEAERVVSTSSTSPNSKISPIHKKNHDSAKENNEEVSNNELTSNHLSEELAHKDNIIHDLEIKVGRLELQTEHLELKIQNVMSNHEMEIESLKKSHGFEISAWETRLERLKKTFEETTLEYEEKIAKLKEKETLIITEHKDRIAKLEEERLADLTKLGEFHRLAMEQAASFTMITPKSNSQVIRLPLRGQERPKDEVELSERESALLEKERQIEVLKATLEAERKELDEALEMEKIRREEHARESRRQSTEVRLREEVRQAEAKREREQLDALALQIKIMRDQALKEQGEIAKDKLELAAERARLEATYSIQGRTEGTIPPLDIMQARAEVEAALETARQAKEAAEMERRRQAEMRQAVEQITWEQKEMDLRLENRERHVNDMLKSAEKLRNEGLSAIEEAKAMKQEMENQQREVKEQLNQIETKERVLAKERLEIAREKIELERRKAQLELILPELNPAEELTINPSKVFVDPKAVIMRLKAEKELESFMTARK